MKNDSTRAEATDGQWIQLPTSQQEKCCRSTVPKERRANSPPAVFLCAKFLYSRKKKGKNNSRLKHEAVSRAKHDVDAQTRCPFQDTPPKTTSHCMFLICFSCTNSKKWQVRFHQLHSHIQLQKNLLMSVDLAHSFCPFC